MDCGLSWGEPNKWLEWEREKRVSSIKKAITDEMDKPYVKTNVYKQFLDKIGSDSVESWRHVFITTNWDYLLQREIFNLNLKVLPTWLDSSHVFHVNGTVELLKDNSQRSPFLLEDDLPEQRTRTHEANRAYNSMLWGDLFVVIGMSFECQIDKFLLHAINNAEDEMPIGESFWIIVNPDETTLNESACRIEKALPRGSIAKIQKKFSEWIVDGMPELVAHGVFT